MIRVLYNNGIMGRDILTVQELDADKLTTYWWRRINDTAMWLATTTAMSGLVTVHICRVEDPGEYWYRDDCPQRPSGEILFYGLSSLLDGEVTVDWWRDGYRPGWHYRTSSAIVRRWYSHD